MVITIQDYQTAMGWLLTAEKEMPNVFLEMTGRGDHQIIMDLHMFAFTDYHRNGRKPIHAARLMSFLSTKCESWRVPKILELALGSGVFKRVAGETDLYIPQPKDQFGL